MFSYSILKKLNQISIIPVRFKHPPNHWSVLRKKIHPIDKALQHFDDFYLKVFEKKWDSIREGLLGKQKYVAVVNNYSDREVIMSELELMGALNMRTLFTLEKQYLKDEFESKNRKSRLEKIWKMEEQIDESLNQVIAETKEFQANQFSLEKSLQDAEIDKERMIDPQNALSAEILQEFVPATKLKGREDFIPESHHYNTFDTSVFDVKVQKEYDIHFPENLNVYCYEIHNFSDFKSPKCGSTGVLGYYLMDGGSVLPVLALNLKPGCSMLDVCASPGGKSLLALQTLYPDSVTSNDVSNSRVSRIENVYRQFLYDLDERWLKTGRIKLTNQDESKNG
ncbi:5-methylcytosine rRNA methyltransferase NSUN4 isoform X2 [Cylas formicarius]|uniref:5-methylcytosine rRNA methyltransferase NSUN4 isoform X2 n=1 Tax=Cylas formicarius TaxID=197179 RepID=UPI0029588F15|nr:5-methylcytosine rRNA methyltransferase NSUN4 isoform X2 [Cylas formicarius]